MKKLLLFMSLPLYGMDYTPPKVIPSYLRDKISREDEKAEIDVSQHHKRHSREHTVIEIHGSVTDAEGKETKLEFKKDGMLEKSADTTGSNDSNQSGGYTKRFVAVSNGTTAVITGLVGAAVTIAIKFGDCKKD